MTLETSLKAARKLITTNGSELIETLPDGSRWTSPIPAGKSSRLALANARRSLAERMVNGEVTR